MKLVDLALVALARRRAANAGALVVTGLLATALALADWTPGAYVGAALDLDLGAGARAALERGLARQGIWTGLLVWLLPLALLHAARTADGWKRRGEVDWLATRPVSRATVVLSTWLGQLATLLVLGLGTLAFVEGVVREAPPTLRLLGPAPAPDSRWFDDERAARWTLPHPGPGGVFTFEASVAHGGPGMWVLVRGEHASADSVRVVGRGEVEVRFDLRSDEVADGAQLKIACNGNAFGARDRDDARVEGSTGYLHPTSGRLWTACSSERRASLNLALRLALTGAAWIALGLGLGTWLSGSLAAFSIGAAWTAAWMWADAPAWLPGARLVDALAVVGRGRVPAELDTELLLGTLACVALGVALGVAGLKDWRRET